MRSAEIRARCVVGIVWLSLCASSVVAEVASFTDSQGRTLLFQYSLKPEWDPAVPRGVLIYFHGNSTYTQRGVLRRLFPHIQRQAYLQDLVPVVVASPEARGSGVDAELQFYRAAPHTGHGTRVWLEEDQSLVQELLQGEFGSAFRVDFDRVVFWGGSQGTCFLNGFVQRYGDDYGGGFLADCGCSEGPDPLWRPPERFKDGFRVFVRAATEDFLHTLSLQAYGYYRYIVGLETWGDLERAGRHCWPGDVSHEAALEWLLHGTGLPEEPEEPRFERVVLMDGIVAITVDSDGTLWVARQPGRTHPASLWRSVDRGNTLEPVSRTSLVVEDLDAVDGVLILTANSREYAWLPEVSFHRSTDAGATFGRLDLEGGEVSSAGTTTDRYHRVYALVESFRTIPASTWIRTAMAWATPGTATTTETACPITKMALPWTRRSRWTRTRTGWATARIRMTTATASGTWWMRFPWTGGNRWTRTVTASATGLTRTTTATVSRTWRMRSRCIPTSGRTPTGTAWGTTSTRTTTTTGFRMPRIRS